MTTWFKVDARELNTSVERSDNRVELNVMLSPYDLPLKVGSYRRRNPDQVIFEISYSNNDEKRVPLQAKDPHSYVSFQVGAVTGRIYQITVSLSDGIEEKHLKVVFSRALALATSGLDYLMESSGTGSAPELREKTLYRITSEALKSSRAELERAVDQPESSEPAGSSR